MRVAIIQHGDFEAAFTTIADGGEETYHAQFYSVNTVLKLDNSDNKISVIPIGSAEDYRRSLTPTIEVCGLNYWGAEKGDERIIKLLESINPTHVVCRTPVTSVIKWCLKRGLPCFPILADSFGGGKTLREKISYWRFGRPFIKIISDNRIPWVSNHNLAAGVNLAELGVDAEKIVPWDWPRDELPENYPVKTLPSGKLTLVFVGALTEEKGLIDALDAIKALKSQLNDVVLDVMGGGDLAFVKEQIAKRGIEPFVNLLGKVPKSEVIRRLEAANIALVPSHHRYSEGAPGTLYQALATRTPVVCSDHPMFMFYLDNDEGVKIVPEKSPQELANAIQYLVSSNEIYNKYSVDTEKAFYKLKHEVKWGDVLLSWLSDPSKHNAFMQKNALTRLIDTKKSLK